MASARLTIPVSAPAAASLDLLLIEQEDWDAYTGKVTTGAMVRALKTMLYGDIYQEEMDCGLVAGDVFCRINVYPRVRGLDYQFAASHGYLSAREEQEVIETETLDFSLATSVTPSHPPLEVLSAAWVDSVVYDAQGNRIAAPALTVDGENIVAETGGQKIYGSAEISYRTERHAYTLTIPRRSEAVDNFYSAVVYGWYEGGVNWETMEMPPGIETFEDDADAICGYSVSGTMTDDDDEPMEQPVTANRTSIVDYCTKLILEDSYA